MRFLNSVKALYAAVGILFLTLVIGTYLDFKNEAIHVRHLEISTGLEKMVRLNQELTNMLIIAVLERNALRASSYDTVNNELELTIKTVIMLTKLQSLQQEISILLDAHAKLHSMEDNILKLMNEEKWDKARSVLFGEEYTLTRKTNEVDSESAVSAVTGELSSLVNRFNRIRMAALALRIGALALLLWIGIMFSRRTKADLSEQLRLSEELSTAYKEMEDRIWNRTADLKDTTVRLAAESEERQRSDARTRLILNSAGEGFFGVNAKGYVTFLNAAATALLGYTADEVLGKNIHGLIHHSYDDGTPYPWEDCPMFHACTKGAPSSVRDETLWRKDGSRFTSEYSVTPLMDETGLNSGAVMVFRDITERRKSAEELRQRMDELERFNRLVIGREERMIQMKDEVNALLAEMGREKKYRVIDAETGDEENVQQT